MTTTPGQPTADQYHLRCVCGLDPALRFVPDGPLTVADAQRLFAPEVRGYLDTATYGPLSYPAAVAYSKGMMDSLSGRGTPQNYHDAVTTARTLFAKLAGIPPESVAIGANVAGFVALIANSIPKGTTVIVSEEEFTSACWPFLAQREHLGYHVKIVPRERLADAVESGVSLVVASAAQSVDGSVPDLDAILEAAKAHNAWTMIDATQSAGWKPLEAERFTFVVCHAYKWITAPRGVAFMAVQPEVVPAICPRTANWYGGQVIWESLYGPPLRLAEHAGRFDTSPAWLAWLGAVPALKLIEHVGVNTINGHDVGLANKFRLGLGMAPAQSPIVSVPGIADAPERLRAAGLQASARAGRARLAFHLFNTEQEVDKALRALR